MVSLSFVAQVNVQPLDFVVLVLCCPPKQNKNSLRQTYSPEVYRSRSPEGYIPEKKTKVLRSERQGPREAVGTWGSSSSRSHDHIQVAARLFEV